jgi:hypothetical protein
MAKFDEQTARLMHATEMLLQHDSDTTFGASAVADMALRMSHGDAARAEELLERLDTFVSFARVELRRRKGGTPILDILSGVPANSQD